MRDTVLDMTIKVLPILSLADDALYGDFRRAALYDLGKDTTDGLVSVYFRTFAIPSGARVLCERGEILRNPRKRASDTGIVVYEILMHGFDHPRSQQMIQLLKNAHRGITSSNDDFLYVLLSLLVVPYRWCRDYGVRPWTEHEALQATAFFAEFGTRIGVHNIPTTLTAAETFFDDYEDREVVHTPEADQLVLASLGVFREELLLPFKPFAKQVLSAYVNDIRICDALGIAHPSRALLMVLKGLGRARSVRFKIIGSPRRPFFAPGVPLAGYPTGYTLDQVGPTPTA